MRKIKIPAGPDFSFGECLWYLNRNYDDCMHTILNDSLYKALKIDKKPYLIKIWQAQDQLEAQILIGEYHQEAVLFIRKYVTGWFDIDRNMAPFYSLLRKDSRLSYMADAFAGLRIVGIPDLFEALCWSIIGQQINLTFAYKLKRRLVEKYGTHLELNNDVFYIFPSCETLAEADPADLRNMQLSTKKAEYIIGVARAFVAGTLSEEILSALPDLSSRQKMLMSIKGIGIWTANYALMKSLKEQSGVPYGDSGLMQALLSHNIISDRKNMVSIHDFFSGLQGWESYMVFYLWRSLAKK
jgi:DNA-3-methyladenine glycosylase II